MRHAPSILVLLPYPSTIGFAIGRLIRPWFAAASRAAGGSGGVHFCFKELDGTCHYLPEGFSNVVGFDVYSGRTSEIEGLASYVADNHIEALMALDLPVETPWLREVRERGVQTVISYFGTTASSINRGPKLFAKRFEVRFLRPHQPDLYIFESRAMARTATHGRGIAADSVTIIPTGVDPEVFHPEAGDGTDAHETFEIPRDRKIVVFMGHLAERKGVRVLLRAANHVVESMGRSDLHFLFLGNREGQEEDFRQDFGPAVAQGFVTFGGYHSEIPPLLTGCYLGCIPSSGWDSFPMSSLEMQACGLPVVVSDLQGTPETIEDGRSGVVVPTSDHVALAEALADLADDPARRQALSDYARRRIVESLTVDHQATRLADAIKTAVSARPQ